MRGILVVALVLTAAATQAAELGKGKANYAAKCSSCHGKDGKGNPAMAKALKVDLSALDLVDEATLGKSDDELTSIATKGVGKMPSFEGKLKPEEIQAVLSHLRSLSKPGEKKEHKQETQNQQP